MVILVVILKVLFYLLQGNCSWCNVSGRRVVLRPISILQLSEAERLALQKIVLQKLQSEDLGCPVVIPKGMFRLYIHHNDLICVNLYLVLRIEYRSSRCCVALFIISHEQTRQNRVCNYHFFILVWLLSRDQLFPEFLHRDHL